LTKAPTQQKHIRPSEKLVAAVEASMEEDFRTFNAQVEYLLRLGLKTRAKARAKE
jgi:hypothetical protein